MHPNQNNLNLPAYPLAATRRIRANRVGLGNLERYLDSIPNDDDGGAGGGGGAAQQNEAWMNDVGLALAATKHRERREARAAAMLEIVDIGQAFPANSAASSPNTNSPREPLSSNPRTPHSTHGAGPSPSISPATTASRADGAGPSCLASPYPYDYPSNASTSTTAGASVQESPRVTRSAFVKLMGYNTKRSAALHSQMCAKWWSSALETPTRNSSAASLTVRAWHLSQSFLFIRTALADSLTLALSADDAPSGALGERARPPAGDAILLFRLGGIAGLQTLSSSAAAARVIQPECRVVVDEQRQIEDADWRVACFVLLVHLRRRRVILLRPAAYQNIAQMPPLATGAYGRAGSRW